jgi:hypothetical protein
MRFRRLSLWIGLVAVLVSSGCCCHHHCGWRHRRCCAPVCGTTCCHPGDEQSAPAYPAHPVQGVPTIYSAPPLASPPSTLHAPMPSAQ